MAHSPNPGYSDAPVGHRWLLALLCVPMGAWALDLVLGTSPLIVAAAIVPAALYALLIAFFQRGSGRPPVLFCIAVLWGAAGATYLSSSLNAIAREWLAMLTHGDDVRAVTAIVVAPVIEEAVKALGLVLLLLLRPDAIRSPRDGIVYGALIGVGFVAAENLVYHGIAALQGGEPGLVRSAYLRGFLGGATHAIFTASLGAGIGWARSIGGESPPASALVPKAFVAAAAGVLAALVQHVAWNAVAASMLVGVVCGAEVPGGTCRDVPTNQALFGWATLITVVFIGPGASGLLLIAQRLGNQRSA